MTRRRFVSFTCYALFGPCGLCKIMPWKAADLWCGETVRSLMFGFFEADQIPQRVGWFLHVDALTLIHVKHKFQFGLFGLFQLIHLRTTPTRHFDDFNGAMTNYYGTDFSCMRAEFLEEQRKWPPSNCRVAKCQRHNMTPQVYSCSQVLLADWHVCQPGVRSLEMSWKYLHLKSLKYVEILVWFTLY